MTSSNGNIFRVTGPLCGENNGRRWIPHTKAGDAELWCFFFIFAWINGWVNKREAGDLRRHCAHYDVIVMRRNWVSSVKPCYCPTRSQYPRDILNWHEWTLIPAWIKSYIHYAVWHDITYPFPKFNGCSSLGMTGNFTPRFMMEVFTYPWWDWS